MVVGVRRVSVVGNSGSGKTTLGRALAGRLGVPSWSWTPCSTSRGGSRCPSTDFRRRVAAVVAGDSWDIGGNYSAVRDLVWARADTVVWLDLPRHDGGAPGRELARCAARSHGSSCGTEIGSRSTACSGSTRRSRSSAGRGHSTTKYRIRFGAAALDPAYAHMSFIRIGSRGDAHRLLDRPRPLIGEETQ